MPDSIILEVDALPQINLEADGQASTTIGVDTIAKGDKGDAGRGIDSVEYTSSTTTTATFLVNYDDDTSQTLVVPVGIITEEERTRWNESLNGAVNANECLTFWHARDVI